MNRSSTSAPRLIAHLDMDAFFASVEQLDNPRLRGKPVIVGGISDRGVVSAASYEARVYGIKSALPVVTARRFCPHGVFLRGRMSRYKEISDRIMDLLRDYSPLVEPISIDEAYLDLTGTKRLFGPAREVCLRIKERIQTEEGLTASIGLAPNKFLAKIASDWDKPDGLTLIAPDQVREFLNRLPVGKIPGVGGRTQAVLREIGIETAGEVPGLPLEFWERKLGKKGLDLFHKGLGLDDSPVRTVRKRKSCGAENTFSRDLTSLEQIKIGLLQQSERAGQHLRRLGCKGKTVSLKIKFDDFKVITRSCTLEKPTSTTKVIFQTACRLLLEVNLQKPVRLTGVSVSNFENSPRQLELLPDPELGKQEELDRVMDLIRDRFGERGLKRGALLDRGK
ncbi:MAG: DNA polymerase IV [Desulfohalobiaceae bacterium]|nr:DNA polymerase IV [Desulfohalobiaceae bacterium]